MTVWISIGIPEPFPGKRIRPLSKVGRKNIHWGRKIHCFPQGIKDNMDGKERGWGGFFRGEKQVKQRTIKDLFTALLTIRKGLFLSRTSDENQEPVSKA